MKAGTTGGNIIIKFSVHSEFLHKIQCSVDLENNSSKKQKLAMRTSPFWGYVVEFYQMKSISHYPPITISVYDVDEKYGEILVGSFSLLLSKIFETSVNSGGGSIERWYKLVPSSDAQSAIKHYGSYWGMEGISSMELCLRFITFIS